MVSCGLTVIVAKQTAESFATTHLAFGGKHLKLFAQRQKQFLVTLVEGDAHVNVAKVEGPIDILFLDADKEGYLNPRAGAKKAISCYRFLYAQSLLTSVITLLKTIAAGSWKSIALEAALQNCNRTLKVC